MVNDHSDIGRGNLYTVVVHLAAIVGAPGVFLLCDCYLC